MGKWMKVFDMKFRFKNMIILVYCQHYILNIFNHYLVPLFSLLFSRLRIIYIYIYKILCNIILEKERIKKLNDLFWHRVLLMR